MLQFVINYWGGFIKKTKSVLFLFPSIWFRQFHGKTIIEYTRIRFNKHLKYSKNSNKIDKFEQNKYCKIKIIIIKNNKNIKLNFYC